MAVFAILFCLALLGLCSGAFTSQRFELQGPHRWSNAGPSSAEDKVTFFVGLKSRLSSADLHDRLLDVSSPRSPNYGKHYSLERIQNEVLASHETKAAVGKWLERALGSSSSSAVVVDTTGAFIEVRSSALAIESAFSTKLQWFKHDESGKRALRATLPLSSPDLSSDLADQITFISLTSPIMALKTSAVKSSRSASDAAAYMPVTSGNKEALARFTAYCEDGQINQQSPPCKDHKVIPTFTAIVQAYANNRTDPYSLEADPLVIELEHKDIRCFNTFSGSTCAGNEGRNCSCLAKVSPLPMYTQLQFKITEFPVLNRTLNVGNSTFVALTDVATPDMLSLLYNIPKGLTVRHGSTQGCAEFYGNQYFSNSDLAEYLALSGLPNNPISPSDCFGSLPYNASKFAGGEAQLDVELLQGLAVGARTSFYNYDEANPYSSENEGFLDFCNTVSKQTTPPLVFSVSYGDVEASIFNATEPGSSAYGFAVDEQFAIMGLRGITVAFSSGDDGLGSTLIRSPKTYDLACSQAWPSWPASSPYVTAVGATMMTDKPTPLCGLPYAEPSVYASTLPPSSYLLAECSVPGETVCTAAFGGVITSGGGFSNVWSRAKSAPWQEAAVQAYLSQPGGKVPKSAGYFNATGRAYPDVSTYGSNFFVYMNGAIIRESGTSGSAPVFAAMVTLWNDMRLAYGLSPLGFINPFLYEMAAAHPEIFNDVTTGNNACGAGGGLTTASCCKESFSAAPGWDASTGLGTPNFRAIANLVVNAHSFFPAHESVEAAVPSAAPTLSPPTSTDASATGSGSWGDYAAASTTSLAGAALFFSLANTLALGAGAWYLFSGRRKQVGPLIYEEDKTVRGGAGGSLYNPLNN